MDKQIIKEEMFYFLSAALAVFILLEVIWPRIILAYFNLNWLLLAWVASGTVLLAKK